MNVIRDHLAGTGPSHDVQQFFISQRADQDKERTRRKKVPFGLQNIPVVSVAVGVDIHQMLKHLLTLQQSLRGRKPAERSAERTHSHADPFPDSIFDQRSRGRYRQFKLGRVQITGRMCVQHQNRLRQRFVLEFLRLPGSGFCRGIPMNPRNPVPVHIIPDPVDLRRLPPGQRYRRLGTGQSGVPAVQLPLRHKHRSRQNPEFAARLELALMLH
ncbi:hypothetical protein D1872_247270 [compost metagenome]